MGIRNHQARESMVNSGADGFLAETGNPLQPSHWQGGGYSRTPAVLRVSERTCPRTWGLPPPAPGVIHAFPGCKVLRCLPNPSGRTGAFAVSCLLSVDLGAHIASTKVDLADGGDQLIDAVAFEDPAFCAFLQGMLDVDRVAVHREDDRPGSWNPS